MTRKRAGFLDRDGTLQVLAGTGEKGFAGDGGPAKEAKFDGVHNLAIAPTGDIFGAPGTKYATSVG